MAKTFPTINSGPSSRKYNPGQYPSATFESLDGTKTHLRYGNKRVNATLTLGFANITDGDVGLILDNYDDVMSVYDYVKFTDANGSAGIEGATLRKEIHNNTGTGKTEQGLKWRYASPPSVTSTFKGLSNVSCSFVACLDSP